MGLFDLFKKKSNVGLDEIDSVNNVKDYSNCIEIAAMISQNDKEVLKAVSECISSPKKYYKDNEKDYNDRGFEEELIETDEIIWFCILDSLIKNGYISEVDWKEDLNSFVENISNFKIIEEAGIEINDDLECLEEDGCVATWAGALDEDPIMQGYVIGGYYIESDSYCFFVCKREELETLSNLAKEIGQRIDNCSKF